MLYWALASSAVVYCAWQPLMAVPASIVLLLGHMRRLADSHVATVILGIQCEAGFKRRRPRATMARLRGAAPSRHAAELPYDLVAEIARAAGGKGARSMRLTCRRWRVGVSQGARTLQVGTCFLPACPDRTCLSLVGTFRGGKLCDAKEVSCTLAALRLLCRVANAQAPWHRSTDNQP